MSKLTIDIEIMHPPALVWRALTEAKSLNEWFQPLAGWPESGAGAGARGKVYPTDELAGFMPFDVELVAAVPPHRLHVQWRGDDFFSEIVCEIEETPNGGSRITARQSGFLGTELAARRDELRRAHQLMVERFIVATDRLAAGAGEGVFLQASEPVPAIAPRHRTRLLSLAGAAVLAILCGTAGAVWLNRGGGAPAPMNGNSDSYSLGTGNQPGVGTFPNPSTAPSGTPQGSPKPSASPVSPLAAAPNAITASYRTSALLGLGGFDTEVTVRNPSGNAHTGGWTVVLTMPDGTAVENRSPEIIKLQQQGATVTLTPVKTGLAANGANTFVVRFPALLALGQSVKSCTIDGRACAAA